jgi:hypothetical protein
MCGLLAGCAGTTPSARGVHVSITAPTDGATVVVPRIVLFGTVHPKSAAVEVSGTRVHVENGAFRRAVLLRRRLTHIKIVARAPGALASTTTLAVRYTPPRRRSRQSLRTDARSGSSLAPSPQSSVTGLSSAEVSPRLASGFMTGCSSSGGTVSGCACIWSQLRRRGFGSVSQFEALVKQWRRSFASQGVIAFPPVVKSALLACAADF